MIGDDRSNFRSLRPTPPDVPRRVYDPSVQAAKPSMYVPQENVIPTPPPVTDSLSPEQAMAQFAQAHSLPRLTRNEDVAQLEQVTIKQQRKMSLPHLRRPKMKLPKVRMPLHHLHKHKQHAIKLTFSAASLFIIATLIFTVVLPYLDSRLQAHAYALDPKDSSVIAKPNKAMANLLQYDAQKQTYQFNADFTPLTKQSTNDVQYGGAKINATLYDDPSKGVTVTDPYNQVELTITPKFKALAGKRESNQLMYPIFAGNGTLVYTAEAGGVKEDLLLRNASKDSLSFSYKLGLDNQYAAKILYDGSLGIYGSSLPINGNVSTSNAKDAALLAKARAKAAKDKLLFTIPAPIIHEANNKTSSATAHFELKGTTLTIKADHLKNANYPLSIDPSVSVTSVADFFRDSNNETNTDFDATNNQITRGAITGGNIGSWAATSSSMTQARWMAGTAIYNGYAYVVGGTAANTTTNYTGASYVEYASISSSTPSSVTWANGNSTGLPAGGLSRFKLIAYNGYLYAIGGSTTDNTCATLSTSVYRATIQVNGVLTNWTTTNAPTTARCAFGATVSNNRIYIAGGKTASTATGTTDVSYATVNPDGSLTWTSGTTPALPAARYGNDLVAYNNFLYVVGGDLNGTLTNTVLYAAISSTGAIFNSSWTSANSFTTARENFGGTFSVARNGYLYISGGCGTIASQICSAIQNDTQLVQINGDGTLGQWITNSGGSTLSRLGGNMAMWNGTMYVLNGCTATAVATTCTTANDIASQQYASFAAAGSVGAKQSTTSTTTALFGTATAVMNGYIYVVGGCITNSCQTGTADTSSATQWAPINADGTFGTWTNDTTNTINSTTGIAATSLLAVNGVLVALGGYTYASGGVSTIWTVTPSATTGALAAAWASNTRNITNSSYNVSSLYFNGNIYIFGGCSSAIHVYGCATYYQTVAKASISGTTMSTFSTASLTQLTASTVNRPNAAMGIAFYNGYVYLCGGSNANATANGGPQTSKCNYVQMLSNGTITGTWNITTGSFNQTITRGTAVAANGYLYVYGGYNGQTPGLVGDINIGQINPSTGDITSFSLASTTITSRWDVGGFYNNGRAYAIAGCSAGNASASCSTRSSLTEYFKVYNAGNDGTRNVVTNANNMSSTETGGVAAAYNGYIYLAGGCNNYQFNQQKCPGGSDQESMYAPINPDGTIGTFTVGPSLPANEFYGALVALNGNLYYIGGSNGSGNSAQATVNKSVIGANGVPGAWDTGVQTNLPNAEYAISTGVFNNVIYVTGGINGNSYATTVWHSTINGSGNITAWTTDTAFSTGRGFHSTVVVGKYLYVIGGFTNSSALSDAQFIELLPSGGTTGSWSYTSDLPIGIGQSAYAAANGYIYIMGGSVAASASTDCRNTIFIAPVNSNGTLGPWTKGSGTSFTAGTALAGAYYAGNFYVLGGNACANGTGVNTVSIVGQQSQAMKSTYSRYAELVADATPQKFNSSGTGAVLSSTEIESWLLNYQSSREATNAWGANTALSLAGFGTTSAALTAIDATSVNQGVARYWFMQYVFDQDATFMFADSSPPTITDYDFYYSSGGGARLRNGGIFQDQTKQSLDAHP